MAQGSPLNEFTPSTRQLYGNWHGEKGVPPIYRGLGCTRIIGTWRNLLFKGRGGLHYVICLDGMQDAEELTPAPEIEGYGSDDKEIYPPIIMGNTVVATGSMVRLSPGTMLRLQDVQPFQYRDETVTVFWVDKDVYDEWFRLMYEYM